MQALPIFTLYPQTLSVTFYRLNRDLCSDPLRCKVGTLHHGSKSVRYPILPVVKHRPADDPACAGCTEAMLHTRHHSLVVPKDLDVSPYFEVIKPR